MFLLAFVNRVRSAQAREPLQMLELGDLVALERAMDCRLEGRRMRFGSPDVAIIVASAAGLRLGRSAGTVELPPAIGGYVDVCATR